MRVFSFFLGLTMLAACNDDSPGEGGAPGSGGSEQGGSEQGGSEQGGSEQGGSPEGGAPVGGAPAGDTLALDIAANEDATVTCATYVEGVWGVAETAFTDGEVANLDCALVAVTVEGEATPFWITSRTFEGLLGTDELRHSFSTADIAIAVGSKTIDLQDENFATLFEGTVETVSLDAGSVEIRVE